ncbi:hypothetical protein [Amnibacterium setariae]|uniref:Asp23/Gls24 family envelope stress response protein n=1 Tax=Amnibacterium setariae TaxID=2306585 RepID=A0A3A1U1S9_9MICO|nr:hypothetical protein [Amnibacterium setariae]RIX30471.1 hypothetical protein D1781_03315 [Amnibacterium setariae]
MSTTSPASPSTERTTAQRVADAALGVDGVHRVGTPVGRAVDRVRSAASAPGAETVSGVRITRFPQAPAARVVVVAEYPVDVVALADRVRSRVAAELDPGTRVDVVVADVHGPYDRDDRVDEVVGDAADRTAEAAAVEGDRVGAAAAETARQLESAAEPAPRPAAEPAPRPAAEAEPAPVRADGTGADDVLPEGSGRP